MSTFILACLPSIKLITAGHEIITTAVVIDIITVLNSHVGTVTTAAACHQQTQSFNNTMKKLSHFYHNFKIVKWLYGSIVICIVLYL